MPAEVRVQSFRLFSYITTGNGGSGFYPAQLLALNVTGNLKNHDLDDTQERWTSTNNTDYVNGL